MSTVHDTAFAAFDLGLCVVPPTENGLKMPATETVTRSDIERRFGADAVAAIFRDDDETKKTWKHWQYERPDREQLEQWYGNRSGIGILTGAASGSVRLFEFDDAATFEAYVRAADSFGIADLVERVRVGYEETTPGGGMHWLVRAAVASGSTKLAERSTPTEENPNAVKTLIETKEDGGYAVLAPSNGRVHPTRGAYVLRSGALSSIITLTAEEWEDLCALARLFDERPVKEQRGSPGTAGDAEGSGITAARGGTDAGDAPWAIYNERTTWAELLEPLGWGYVRSEGTTQYWRRPDKNRGVSASVNKTGRDTLICFSSSTKLPDLSPSSYTKAAVYTYYQHGGDFSAAGKALYAAGYRKPKATGYVGGMNRDGGSDAGEGGVSGATAPTATRADFLAIPSQDRYVYRPTREFWRGEAVNRLLPTGTWTDPKGKEHKEPSTAAWLTQHQRAEQMTWMPGEPEIITDRYLVSGAWQARPGARAYNLYQAPHWRRRDEQRPTRARPWLRLVQRLYPDEWDHIVAWLAWRVQRPGVKINHALVLGGDQGIGKDTILDPLRCAVGAANCVEVSPQAVMGQFNDFVRSVILRISEIRDLGDVNRYSFYEHTKTLIASPPEVLTCNQKYLQPYPIPNLTGVIFTTNHRQGGLYLPADDRRHFVCWSEVQREGFSPTYFPRLYRWLDAGGREEVAAYLADIDLDGFWFNPKAPPPHTQAWRQMVDAGQASETTELADLIETMGSPPALTLMQISALAQTLQRYSLVNWLADRKNLRQIPHRLAEAGYVPVRNPVEVRGRWTIAGQKQTVYAQRELSPAARMVAAAALR